MASDRDEGRPMPLLPPETKDYEQLIDDYSHFAPPAEGEVLQGHVLKVTPTEVIVDFGYKSEGLVPIAQVTGPDGTVTVRPGDTIDVVVDRKGEEPEGYILLSHERAGRIRAWDTLEKAYREHLLVSGRVMGRIKGGLAVDVGVQAFMPSSHADVRPVHNLDALIGQDIAVRIVKLNRRRGNVVVSRKLAVEEEFKARKAAVLAALQEGALVTGVVKGLTEYGAFVDLGGIDGLLHVSDISTGGWGTPPRSCTSGRKLPSKFSSSTARRSASRWPEAGDARSLGQRGRALPGQQPRHRARGQHHRLRCVRRVGAGGRRFDSRLRNDLVAPAEASFQGR